MADSSTESAGSDQSGLSGRSERVNRSAEFSGRTALVTGGSRGIGRSTCRMLAEQGARVAINYARNEEAARASLAMVEEAGTEGMIVQADVSSEADVNRMAAEVRARLGPVDLLVNNAGIAKNQPHSELAFADWKRMFEVNVDGVFLATWAVKDEMIERGFGRIVNVASLAGIILKKDMIHYATTKAAVISLTRHCAEAFAPHNVRVNCVAPGLTDTDLAGSGNPGMIDRLIASTPMGRIAQPGEMASVIRFLLSEDSSFVTGQTVTACGGRS
ncbi:MAG: glucose 1-dehydrogenase [Gemmatimonadetes bacterium]|nr:glucose 1-dehydrogenase [Gemmatimonadota bacterium]